MLTQETKRKYHLKWWLIIAIILVLCFIAWAITYRILSNSHDDEGADIQGSALVQTVAAKTSLFSRNISAYGTITTATNDTSISSQSPAIVKEILVYSLVPVKKGDPLIVLSPTAETTAALQNARASTAQATRELGRQKKLLTEYLATNADVQNAQLNLSKEQNNLHTLLTEQGNGDKTIYADYDGVVSNVTAQLNQIVTPGTSLLTLSNMQTLQVSLNVSSNNVAFIKPGQTVTLNTLDNPPTFLTGTVLSISNEINPQDGLITVRVTINQPPINVVLLNAPVEGYISLETPQKRILLPRASVLYPEGSKDKMAYVYINQGNKAIRRNVTIAGADDENDQVAIANGVSSGDHVIVTGNDELQEGMALRTEN
jgi:RND family efflux transporter MFP subunit